MASLSGKVAMVTGGAGAFGKAFTEAFLQNGCKVLICDINENIGNEVLQNFQNSFAESDVLFSKCDVTSDESFKAAFDACKKAFGKIDILVNNAGVGNEKDFQICMNVNLGGTIRGTALALEHMGKDKGNDGGQVVNIASIAGLKVVPFGPYYSASKSGIVHYTRAVGHPFHFNYTGVTIQCLCPSLVETPFIVPNSNTSYNPQSTEAAKKLFGNVPLLDTKEVADALILLIEEKKPGAVMALEKNKDPYYVEASVK